MARGEAVSSRRPAPREKKIVSSREPDQTESTVYFILGTLAPEVRSQNKKWFAYKFTSSTFKPWGTVTTYD